MVKDRQTGQLVPACATAVVDGMEIESETDEVHEVRRTALGTAVQRPRGRLPGPVLLRLPGPHGHPADAPADRRATNLREAIATVKQDIALPAVLGRVCPKPCEKGCRRNAADGPVAVCD